MTIGLLRLLLRRIVEWVEGMEVMAAMPSSTHPVRKKNRFGGLQVTICGRRIHDRYPNLVCSLPHRHLPSNLHGTVALTDDFTMVAVYVNMDTPEEVQMWQLVGPQE